MSDVLVIGAGAVGLYAASAFATAGLDVELWDKRDEPGESDRPPLSRAIGIHPPALHALDAIGAADAIIDEAVPVRRAHARVTLAIGADARTRDVGSVSFAGVSSRFPFVATLPQHRTHAILADAIRRLDPSSGARAVSVSYGMEVVGIAPDVRGVTVRGVPTGSTADEAGARQVRPRFVVIAEGGGSMSRRRLGVSTADRTYRDTYLMGDAADTTGDGPDAVVTLTPDGVVESFPLPGGVRRFVAHTPALLEGAGADTLERLVHARTGHRLDPASVSMLSAFGVRRRIAEHFAVGSRIAIVGDAAHEISPIGGQGMNLGWLDVAELVPVVTELLRGSPAGSTASLAEWGVRRRRIAVAAARQAEANMLVSAAGTPVDLRVRSLALRAALRGRGGARLARVYAMGGDANRS
ncbi:FAD-dependent oxidoreductase [Labedella endophytica]|uniref:FAD-dependent monooxygenase n=1 Tax=Labedella endophytica TaxID=1523160 RepID=A0A3S0Y2M6_9MICO|nr:NAD(P)/FAD-dependent oxidoreductase [Labedella endophytica]RUR03296.1 FAD-dependent monooxygenase [Labedella endophytica]